MFIIATFLITISSCKKENGNPSGFGLEFKKPVLVNTAVYFGFNEADYTVKEIHRLTKEKIKVVVRFGGCERYVDMKLVYVDGQDFSSPYCKFVYEKSYCKMLIQREFIVDLTDLPDHVRSLEIETQNQGIIKLK